MNVRLMWLLVGILCLGLGVIAYLEFRRTPPRKLTAEELSNLIVPETVIYPDIPPSRRSYPELEAFMKDGSYAWIFHNGSMKGTYFFLEDAICTSTGRRLLGVNTPQCRHFYKSEVDGRYLHDAYGALTPIIIEPMPLDKSFLPP